MNEVVFQLAVVFAPGLIWTSVVDALCTTTGARSTTRTVTRAFGFGIISYMVYFAVYYAGYRLWCGAWPHLLDSMQSAPGVADLRVLRPQDVFFASVSAFMLAVGWSATANRRVFSRLMRYLRVTRKYGDEGVWEFVFNMGTAVVEYVNIRDFENKVIYSGYVKAFSEGGGVREVLLERAGVFELGSGRLLYEMPLVYVSKKTDALHVEFPFEPKPDVVQGDAQSTGRGASDV